jgi:hypothetical protein
MALALAPHLHLAVLGDDVVLLDLRADAYLCLPGGRKILRPRADGAAISPIDAEAAAAFVDAGWIQAGAAGRPARRRRLAAPTRDIGLAPGEPVAWRDLVRLTGAVCDLARGYRRRSLPEILAFVAEANVQPASPDSRPQAGSSARVTGARVTGALEPGARARGERGGGDPCAETLRLARVFHRLAPWLPIPDKCLSRSFVLLRLLQRSGVGARWMFGVRTWPFAAHCWLQQDAVALDDAADRLAGFRPIFALG